MVYQNELLPFIGGPTAAGQFKLVEKNIEIIFDDGAPKQVKFDRFVTVPTDENEGALFFASFAAVNNLSEIKQELLKIQNIGQPQGSVTDTEKIYHLGKDLAFVYKQIVWATHISFMGFSNLDTIQLAVPQQDFFVFGQDNTGKMVTVKSSKKPMKCCKN